MPRKNDGDDAFTVDGRSRIVRSTESALLIQNDSILDEETWIPKSVVHDDSEVYEERNGKRHSGALVVKMWFAKKEGWTS